MEVIGQLHAPAALPPGKKPPVPVGLEAGWAPEPVWTVQAMCSPKTWVCLRTARRYNPEHSTG
jgi:hypothetical protein